MLAEIIFETVAYYTIVNYFSIPCLSPGRSFIDRPRIEPLQCLWVWDEMQTHAVPTLNPNHPKVTPRFLLDSS